MVLWLETDDLLMMHSPMIHYLIQCDTFWIKFICVKVLKNIVSDSKQWSSQSSSSMRFTEEWVRKGLRWFYHWARIAAYTPPCHRPWCVAAMQVIQTHKALLTHTQCWHCLLSLKRTLVDCLYVWQKPPLVYPFPFIMARQNLNIKALMTFKPKFRLTIKCSSVVAALKAWRLRKLRPVAEIMWHFGESRDRIIPNEGGKNAFSSGIPSSWYVHTYLNCLLRKVVAPLKKLRENIKCTQGHFVPNIKEVCTRAIKTLDSHSGGWHYEFWFHREHWLVDLYSLFLDFLDCSAHCALKQPQWKIRTITSEHNLKKWPPQFWYLEEHQNNSRRNPVSSDQSFT